MKCFQRQFKWPKRSSNSSPAKPSKVKETGRVSHNIRVHTRIDHFPLQSLAPGLLEATGLFKFSGISLILLEMNGSSELMVYIQAVSVRDR